MAKSKILQHPFWALNKKVVIQLGWEAAGLLQYLLELQRLFKIEYFYQSQERIQHYTGINPHMQRKHFKTLVNHGYISIKPNGHRNQHMYRVNEDAIVEFVESVESINNFVKEEQNFVKNQKRITEQDIDDFLSNI